MISSIEITRFRGIREGKLEELTPLVVLVGPNGCGKSSVLDAMLIGANYNPQAAMKSAVDRHKGLPNAARWFLYRADETGQSHIALTTSEGDSQLCEIRMLGTGPHGHLQCVVTQRQTEDVTPGEMAPGLTAEMRLAGAPEVRLIEPRVLNTQPPLHELYTRTVEHGRRDEAKAIISAVVPGVEHLEILTEGNEPIIHLVFKDHSVPAAFAGDGVYSLVRLSLELASRPHGSVLIEEPEVHQHPGAIRQTVRAILAAVHRDIQVILTTHSLELIDSILAELSDEDQEKLSLYRLQLDDGVLKSRRMSGSEVAFARGEIENDLR